MEGCGDVPTCPVDDSDGVPDFIEPETSAEFRSLVATEELRVRNLLALLEMVSGGRR